jgi:hypothetical protein
MSNCIEGTISIETTVAKKNVSKFLSINGTMKEFTPKKYKGFEEELETMKNIHKRMFEHGSPMFLDGDIVYMWNYESLDWDTFDVEPQENGSIVVDTTFNWFGTWRSLRSLKKDLDEFMKVNGGVYRIVMNDLDNPGDSEVIEKDY